MDTEEGLEEIPLYMPSQEYHHEYSNVRRQKKFNDNVHGHFALHRASVAIIDTPEFQRLRNLKQLGLAYKVYPSASHNRFEHSLGVAHLADKWGWHLLSSRDGVGVDGQEYRRLEPEDRQHLTVLQLAGLTHDLGHGPFSHVFEKELLPRLGLDAAVVKEWEHETMSNRIFDHILEDPENGIDLQELARLEPRHITLIKQLMHGSTSPHKDYHAAPWLFDVVANKRNGVDADKFDYLARDSLMCGVKNTLDASRLMMYSRISPDKGEIVYKQTEYTNLAQGLFLSRAEMHRSVYTHSKIKSVEFMVCDAAQLAAGPLGLREALAHDADISLYLALDDSLLQRIKLLNPDDSEKPDDVRKAQALLAQLDRRKLYKFVNQVVTSKHEHHQQVKPSAEEIVGYQSTADTGVHLNPDDVIVCEVTIDQGMKARNPMTNVKFYQTSDPEAGDAVFHMDQESVSRMLATQYQDRIIRVYSKNPDPKVISALKRAFQSWSHHRLNCLPPGTPWRPSGQHHHQQPPQPPPSVTRPGRTGSAGNLAQQMFRGADSNGDANGVSGSEGAAAQQHMGSGGRSRKRSLNPDMAAVASQGSQEQQGALAMNGTSSSSSQGGGSRPTKLGRISSSTLPDIAEEEGEPGV